MMNQPQTPSSLLRDGCGFCKKDVNPINLVELPGLLSGFACTSCLRERKKWCDTHRQIHLGYIDGTSACRGCIKKLVKKSVDLAREFLVDIRKKLPAEQVEILDESLEVLVSIGMPEEEAFANWLASYALRTRRTMEELIEYMKREMMISMILPNFF